MRPQAVTCARCGAKVRENRVRCLRCGELLVAASTSGAQTTVGRAGLVVGGIASVLIVAGLWLAAHAPAAEPLAPPPRPAAAATPPRAAARQPDTIPAVPTFLDAASAGRVAYRRGEIGAALAGFEEAARDHPDDPEVLNSLGQVLVRLGRAADAVPHFDRAVVLAPRKWSYRFNRARAYGLLEQWPRAVDEYRAALALFPGDYVTEYNLGLALDKVGRGADAVEHLQRAAADQPHDPMLHLALAVIADRGNRVDDALAAYGRFLELSPAGPDADRARGRVAALRPALSEPGSSKEPPADGTALADPGASAPGSSAPATQRF